MLSEHAFHEITSFIDRAEYYLSCLGESPSPFSSDLSVEDRRSKLILAVNRGDRQVVRAEIRAQLNITSESENAISMGRLYETHLEEVTAGGSYWMASIGGETLLYPTEQTLKGYSQSQRPTGIFTYIRQPIPSAQIVSPARLALNGSSWRVAEPGSIAIPA